MTANAVLSPEPPPRRSSSSGISATVRLIRDSYAHIEPHADEVARFFYGMLFSLAPQTRELFPVNMEVQRSRLLRALVHFVQMVDRPDDLLPFLRQLGRDHRKFGVVVSHYEAVGTALLSAIKKFAADIWTPKIELAWAEAYTIMATTMQQAADADENPAWWNAQVIDHRRLSWDLALVRVQPQHPVPYRAGQYVSVEVPQRPRLWRYMTPANAPAADGSIEFHIRAVDGGWVSRSIVGHTQYGDNWRIGPPMGRMSVDREQGRDVVMVAGGTGLAPMRAVIDELARYGENPRVHLFVGGRTLEDIYDLDNLHRLSITNPWLTIVPVVESGPPRSGVEQGTLADAVTRYGSWTEREVLVCGSPGMIRATVSRMLVAGTPLERIRYDPFTLD
ncbi:FAD-binding oxidoreductase [Actinoalloteichus hymeniacidonis]|uniref:nitric oxide dioxygenase n=1 Tax=Actinoalloteichus hymeniacidonis TaxID=340345 RepID=A0AAC9N0W2_9PSEU|nr:FAD-binding oxidoreductase [Actinoalloteichus hymeniacidonis]AOS66029.1 2-polyprenylphenol hydroxylase-like oxidoreductase [Actinoalloteichus hymeniacidonis]